jgi:hypothetical protein
MQSIQTKYLSATNTKTELNQKVYEIAYRKMNGNDFSDFSREELSEYVDELLGYIVRGLGLEWSDVCDEVNEIRADLEMNFESDNN